MTEDYIRFDESKFVDVVHYICANCDQDKLGNVKLHKILYFADMIHFAEHRRPLTGVDYLKQRFGPVARFLSKATGILQAQGRLRVETTSYFGFEKKNYISLQPPRMTSITNSEADLLKEVIDFVCLKSARAISDLSHDLAWSIARLGERIPYAAADGWEAVEVTQEDVELAVAEARRIRPVIEGERREGRVL
jgi:uncharacterized phage-associated protein